MKEEGRGGGSELGSDLDLDPDLDPWKILWIQIWQNYADPLDPDPQHWGAACGKVHLDVIPTITNKLSFFFKLLLTFSKYTFNKHLSLV